MRARRRGVSGRAAVPPPGPDGVRAGAALMTEAPADSGRLAIDSTRAIVRARKLARRIAAHGGFNLTDTACIVAAVGQLARTVHRDAGHGHMAWRRLSRDGRAGLELVFEGAGDRPGPDLDGAERLMDEIDVRARPGEAPAVTVRKWRR